MSKKKPIEKSITIRHFNCGKYDYVVPYKNDNQQLERFSYFEYEEPKKEYYDDYRLIAKYDVENEEPKTLTFTRKIDGVKGYQYIEFERLSGDATIYLNGKEIGNNKRKSYHYTRAESRPYRFYCSFKEGDNEIKIVSTVSQTSTHAISGYVKIGKLIEEPWSVKLHYGKARLFIKTENQEKLKIKVGLEK